MKIRDMAKCLEEFEQLCRAFLKSKNIVDKEGVPSFYIRLLADLEDYLNQVNLQRRKKKKQISQHKPSRVVATTNAFELRKIINLVKLYLPWFMRQQR